MRYPQLRRRLEELASDPDYPDARPDVVYFGEYDRVGGQPWLEGWEIRVTDGVWELGFFERGRFSPRETFASEELCCEWLLQELTRSRPKASVSEEELEASIAAMQRRIAAERAERNTPERDDES